MCISEDETGTCVTLEEIKRDPNTEFLPGQSGQSLVPLQGLVGVISELRLHQRKPYPLTTENSVHKDDFNDQLMNVTKGLLVQTYSCIP